MIFTIPGRLSGLNEYTNANRRNAHEGANLKRENQNIVQWAIRGGKLKKIDKYPVELNITWYEPNSRRDIDNVTFAVKFILDALVVMGILENDSQKYVKRINNIVLVDKKNSRIEVEIKPIENDLD